MKKEALEKRIGLWDAIEAMITTEAALLAN
jgi:hypothetical protein